MTHTTGTAHVRHRFDASAEDVFDAWLNPDILARWMFNPAIRNEEVIKIEIQPRKGGSFRFVIKREGQTHEYEGTYLDIQRPTQLVFTWVSKTEPRDSLVSVTITPRPKGCDLNLVHELGETADELVALVATRWQAEFGALSNTIN
ncbi:SRPBCC family protein [Kordiimonas aestuarii]|uniref:SRPBCC family protein n=1 Tax=Kordiimonas aestuarii TaxID=1005925 RepID=UPI0021D0B557|nr:SRPBCC family protein [Kordiimonas aestuarii]